MEKCFIDSANGAIYCNSCGVCTRYERQKAAERKSRGIPEIKINTDQVKKINNVWPISGWAANNKAINKVNKKENRYFK